MVSDKLNFEVDLTKRVLSHARGNTTTDVREDQEYNESWEGDTMLEP